MRHDLPEIRQVAGLVGAEARACRSAEGDFSGIDHLACSDVNVSGLVVVFEPGFVEFVTEADVEGQVGPHLVIVIHKTRKAPLALPNIDAAESDLRRLHAVQHKVRHSVPPAIHAGWIGGEGSGIVQRTKVTSVVAGGVVVLVAHALNAHADKVQPVLPGQVVDVAEGVVNEVVTVIGRSAHAAYAAADALVGKPVICLVEEGDSDLGIARGSEDSGGIGGQAFRPFGPRKTDARRIDERRREGMNPVAAQEPGGEIIEPWKADGQHRDRTIERGGH